MDHKQEIRKTIVESVRIQHSKPGDMLHPDKLFEGEQPKEVWTVWIRTRTGLLPPDTSSVIFFTEEEAREFERNHPVGSVTEDRSKVIWRKFPELREHFDKMMKAGWLAIPKNAGDRESPLAFDILMQAGITTRNYGLSGTCIPQVACRLR